MIDFRYHLVSLVAVFLALAIGIVLGAGPLQEDLGTALTDQVGELREERAALRSDLADAESARDAADARLQDYAGTSLPAIVDGRLQGAAVAVVIMPEGSAQVRDAGLEALTLAGAEVTSVTQLEDAWTAPDQAATRAEVATAAAETLPDPGGADAARDLPAVFAQALSLGDGTALDTMATAGLLTRDQVPEDGVLTPDAVVVIGGGGSAVPAAPDASSADRVEEEVLTVAALGEQQVPTALLGDTAAAESATGSASDALVTAVRADAAGGTVSTIDNGSEAAGEAALVLALVLASDGEVGAFGVADDATAVLPDVSGLPAAPWLEGTDGPDPAPTDPAVPTDLLPEFPTPDPTGTP